MTRNLISRYLLDIIYPNRCPVCDHIIKWDNLVCEDCVVKLNEPKGEYCRICGKPKCICNETNLYYDACICGGFYENAMKAGVISLKLNNGINFAHYIVGELINDAQNRSFFEEIDVVTSVPMTKKKLTKRGYNQSEIIAKYIAKLLSVSYISDALVKSNDAKEQHTLSYSDRILEVKNAYILGNPKTDLKAKTVLICDDVVTTTSTINKCAELLKSLGAHKVYCLCLATTTINNQNLKKIL